MKKNHCNICTMNLLLLALSTGMILLTSCTNADDPVLNEISTENTYTITVDATLAGTDANQTRALGFDGGALKTTWAATDKVSVYYKSVFVGTLSPTETGTSSTSLTGTLSFPTSKTPASLAKLNLYFPDKEVSYEGQDGTLATIAANTDYAQAEVRMTTIDDANKTITAAAATFTKQQAIVKFTLKDKDDNSINASNLIVNNISITTASPTNELFVAIPEISNSDISITASVGSDIYTYSRSSVTFENGKYYTAAMKMSKMDAVQLWSGGPYWAKVNIGAANEGECGWYFSWSNVTESNDYTFQNTRQYILYYREDNEPKFWKYNDSDDILDAVDDAAYINWGSTWRMPTKKEFDDLLTNTTQTYDDINKGIRFTGKDSYNGVSIFLPCTGYFWGKKNLSFSESCFYWTSTCGGTKDAYAYIYNSSTELHDVTIREMYQGMPIRPVHD